MDVDDEHLATGVATDVSTDVSPPATAGGDALTAGTASAAPPSKDPLDPSQLASQATGPCDVGLLMKHADAAAAQAAQAAEASGDLSGAGSIATEDVVENDLLRSACVEPAQEPAQLRLVQSSGPTTAAKLYLSHRAFGASRGPSPPPSLAAGGMGGGGAVARPMDGNAQFDVQLG